MLQHVKVPEMFEFVIKCILRVTKRKLNFKSSVLIVLTLNRVLKLAVKKFISQY